MPRKTKRRPVIGVIPGWLAYEGNTPDRYLNTVFKGIQSQAALKGCNILLAWGGGRVVETSRVYPAWPVVAVDSDFVPVGPWNTDGLIVLAPILNETRSAHIQQFIADEHPVLFIASGEKGPSLIYDNESGIHQAVAHLIDHGHRRIAFIAGNPNDMGDSDERYHAYLATLAAAGLEIDPRLVAFGRHSFQGGYSAMRQILQSKVEFSAVQASNDVSALGAMRALREAGLNIPWDIAIAGFDDQRDAIAQIPPLTSVHTPLLEIGAQALDQMLLHLEQKVPLTTLRVPTRLVRRQSCGCLPEKMVFHTGPGAAPPQTVWPKTLSSKPGGSELAAFKKGLVAALIAEFPDEVHRQIAGKLQPICANLVSGLLEPLTGGDLSQFHHTLLVTLQAFEHADADIQTLQYGLSVLRQILVEKSGGWLDEQGTALLENMFHQARVAISESLMRSESRHFNDWEEKSYKLNILTSR